MCSSAGSSYQNHKKYQFSSLYKIVKLKIILYANIVKLDTVSCTRILASSFYKQFQKTVQSDYQSFPLTIYELIFYILYLQLLLGGMMS